MKRFSHNFSVLIPDSDDHKLLPQQVVNCLSLFKDVRIFIMTSKRHNHLKYSRYVNHVSYYPKTDTKTWLNQIDTEVEKYDIDIIMPIFDKGIEYLLQYKDELRSKHKICLFPSYKNYLIACDKGLLYQHLKINHFPCPESVVVKSNELPLLNELSFPIIAKPVIGFGGGLKIKVLKNQLEVIKHCESIRYDCNTIYQNFVLGYDLSCNVLCENGKLKAYTIQSAKKTELYDFEPQTSFSFVDESKLITVIKEIMQSLEWSGVANIDCRYDEKENDFKIIEINARYWMNIDASALAKVSFPYLHCLLTLDQHLNTYKADQISYLNLKGLARQILKHPLTIFKFKYLKRNTPLQFVLKDPIPMIYFFVWRTRNMIHKKMNKS